METYLAIITTVLVVTQLIRVAQNAYQLYKLNVTDSDFEIQRKVFRMLYLKLQKEWEDSKE